MRDAYGRVIDYLRISVTDRCNLRCVYCLPQDGGSCTRQTEPLTLQERLRICSAAARLGMHKFRVTGGEPLLYPELLELIAGLKAISTTQWIGLTTNGIGLAEKAADFRRAGLDGVNISLDTLSPEKFLQITGCDAFGQVYRGIQTAQEFLQVKINCVAIQEWNGDELTKIAGIAKENAICVRFIELMPIGQGARFTAVPAQKIQERLRRAYGEPVLDPQHYGNGPAVYLKYPDFLGSVGFISAMSHEFCSSCNRVRLTCDGFLKPCLNYRWGTDLKQLLRTGCSDSQLEQEMRKTIAAKPERHHFLDLEKDEKEQKNMAQIGG